MKDFPLYVLEFWPPKDRNGSVSCDWCFHIEEANNAAELENVRSVQRRYNLMEMGLFISRQRAELWGDCLLQFRSLENIEDAARPGEIIDA